MNKEKMDNKLNILLGPDEGRSIILSSEDSYILGSSSHSDIYINDPTISQLHLLIFRKDQKYYISDMGSENGTFLYGKKLEPGVGTEWLRGVPVIIGTTVIGLGEASKIVLKPFFKQAGIDSKYSSKPSLRVNSIKRNLGFIYNINDLLSEPQDTDETLEKLLDTIFNFFMRIDRCVFIVTGNKLDSSKTLFRSRRDSDGTIEIYNRNFVKELLSFNRPFMVSDINILNRESSDIEGFMKSMYAKSAMCIPLSNCLKTFGLIYLDSKERTNSFRTTDFALLKDISGRIADSMYNISLGLLGN